MNKIAQKKKKKKKKQYKANHQYLVKDKIKYK